MFSILVVEDNADMRELFCTVLTDGGYRAIPAADGQEALEVMERQYIDLIAADVMMPRMDGYELTRELRSTSKKTGGLPHLQALSVTFGDSSPGGRAKFAPKEERWLAGAEIEGAYAGYAKGERRRAWTFLTD